MGVESLCPPGRRSFKRGAGGVGEVRVGFQGIEVNGKKLNEDGKHVCFFLET